MCPEQCDWVLWVQDPHTTQLQQTWTFLGLWNKLKMNRRTNQTSRPGSKPDSSGTCDTWCVFLPIVWHLQQHLQPPPSDTCATLLCLFFTFPLSLQSYQWLKEKIVSEDGRKQQAKLKELNHITEKLGCTLPQLAVGTSRCWAWKHTCSSTD